MKKSSAAVILLVVLCVTINDVKSRRSARKVKSGDRIVGGRKINIEDAPYQVSLKIYRADYVTVCSGSIINETYILTAAHCLIDVLLVEALVGTAEFDEGGTKYNSTIFYTHPLYDEETYDYDVGVIKIVEGIVLNGNTTKIIKLVDEGTDLETGTNILVTGWGVTHEDAVIISDFLMGVEVPIVSQDDCQQSIDTLTSRQFCAGEPEGGKDTCQGDSGGPAVLVESGIQVGITSFGYGCGRKEYPGVYTNIAYSEVRSFIRNYTNV